MDKLGASLERKVEEDEEHSILRPELDETEEASTEIKNLSYEKLEIDFIREVDPENPWLKEAEATDNETMIEAICIVFKALIPSKWRGVQAGKMIGSIMKELEKHA